MRIMWHSVPPWYTTGYGVQTKLFTRIMRDLGHDVTISSIVPAPEMRTDDGFTVLSPGVRGNMGNDFLYDHATRTKADLVISMCDTFIMDAKKVKKVVDSGVKFASFQVIDSEPFLKHKLAPVADASTHRLAMSLFGRKMLNDAGYTNEFIPLAFDEAEYNTSRLTHEEARNEFSRLTKIDLNGRFFVVMNSANMSCPSRKNFSAAFRAFRHLLKFIPNAIMYCHTECTGLASNGEDLRIVADQADLTPENVFFPPQYEYNMGLLTEAYLNCVYRAADVLLVSSRGEGFCVPMIEAQASGCPVLAVAFSAMVENAEPPSRLCNKFIEWDYFPGAKQAIVDPFALGEELIIMASTPVDEEARAKMADTVTGRYSTKAVKERVRGFLDKIKSEKSK